MKELRYLKEISPRMTLNHLVQIALIRLRMADVRAPLVLREMNLLNALRQPIRNAMGNDGFLAFFYETVHCGEEVHQHEEQAFIKLLTGDHCIVF